MENLEKQQEQELMIRDLIFNIKLTLDLGDFKTRREIAEYVETKARLTAEDAENYGYEQAKSVAQEISDRVGKLKNIQKAHLIERRIQETLDSINY